MKNAIKFLLAALVCAACGGAEVYNDPDLGPVVAGEEPIDGYSDDEIGIAQQAIGTGLTLTGIFNTRSYTIGVHGFNNSADQQSYQAQPALNEILVPNTHVWSVKFAGFTAGTELTRITNNATASESLLNSNLAVGSSWFHVNPGVSARIQIEKIADDGLNDKSTIDKFGFVTCSPTAGAALSEPTPINGVYRAIAPSAPTGSCKLQLRLAKVLRLVSGTTPQDRVIKHFISYGLAAVAGAGSTAANTFNATTDVTNRKLNENQTKNTMPGGQVCLMQHWCGDSVQNYALDFGCGFFCDELPVGY